MDENYEGLIKKLYEGDTVYRPIIERDSVLLEVQLGCSYRKCTFCDFARDTFRRIPLDKIKENIRLLADLYPTSTSIFLLGQNALSIQKDVLLEILGTVREYMPAVEEVSMYGRVDDIHAKGFTGMAQLMAAGLTTLHVGVESGSDRVLQAVNKGVNSSDMRKAFKLLNHIGINYHISYILGLGGKALWREHAAQTVRLFNEIQPVSIWALNLLLWPDTPLAEQAKSGKFTPLTPEEALFEEKLILEQAFLDQCFYMDTTALGKYTIAGLLPSAKGQMLDAIDGFLNQFDWESFLYS